ncbi:hypothetical protein BPAE_0397g00020 [Botrytis paeoniae]|uniref:Uncharacterized protein n=1 Tax=Botrytis paeoniae TaxID=278948 RepID=A0A4Z1F133_9HELO|nr:hypothetical protein BPAE_0397g00020 [Botrytis paeoniae]
MPTSPESDSSESLLTESPSPKSISPKYPSSEFTSREPSLIKFISPKSPSPESPSPKSPLSESHSSRPQSPRFVDRGLKVQVCLNVLVENGGYNSVRGRGPSILCDSLLDIDSPQDWWQMLRNLQQIIDLQLVSLLGASPEIVDVFVIWDGDVPPECDGWSKWSEWLKCKRWNDIGVKTMKLYKREKGPRHRPDIFTVQAPLIMFDLEVFLLIASPLTQTPLKTFNQIFHIVLEYSAVGSAMSDRSSSGAQPSITPGIQIRAMNISDGSFHFLCDTTLGIVSPPDFSAVSTTLIQAINIQTSSEKLSCIEEDISIFIHWAGETPDKYAYQTVSRCWNNISLDLMLLSEKKFSVDSPNGLKDLWSFLAKRKYRDEIFCIFEASPIPLSDRTSESEKDIERDLIHSDG